MKQQRLLYGRSNLSAAVDRTLFYALQAYAYENRKTVSASVEEILRRGLSQSPLESVQKELARENPVVLPKTHPDHGKPPAMIDEESEV